MISVRQRLSLTVDALEKALGIIARSNCSRDRARIWPCITEARPVLAVLLVETVLDPNDAPMTTVAGADRDPTASVSAPERAAVAQNRPRRQATPRTCLRQSRKPVVHMLIFWFHVRVKNSKGVQVGKPSRSPSNENRRVRVSPEACPRTFVASCWHDILLRWEDPVHRRWPQRAPVHRRAHSKPPQFPNLTAGKLFDTQIDQMNPANMNLRGFIR
jgi:hypothetical protein